MKADYICASITTNAGECAEVELKRADDSNARRSVCDECAILVMLPDAELSGMFEVGQRYFPTLTAEPWERTSGTPVEEVTGRMEK